MKKAKYLPFLIAISISISCNNHQGQNSIPNVAVEAKKEVIESEDCQIAINFINSYLKQIDPNRNSKVSTEEWIKQNQKVTDKFKRAYVKAIKDAIEEDPDLGLEYDYVLDAQDYPEGGFESKNCESKNGVVKLVAENWDPYFLKIKLVKENGQTKIDACGTINIPENERYAK